MRITIDSVRPEMADAILNGLYRYNLIEVADLQRRFGARYPSLFEKIIRHQIRYNRRDPNEVWKTYTKILADGEGDCEDLAAGIAAEMTVAGSYAEPRAYRVNPTLYHVVVDSVDYGLLDPSVAAGMGTRPAMSGLLPTLASRMAGLL